MTNSKSTKRALLTSAISMLLCVSMLLGTTFAWFTDSVVSENNIIKAGNLKVTLHYADGTQTVPTDDSGWEDASTKAIFNYQNWEPGYTDVKHVKIGNAGTLALKYQINIAAEGELSNLADVIDVYFIDPAAQVVNRTDLPDANRVGTLTEILGGMPANASGTLLANESDTVTIALKMQESAGNEYQGLTFGEFSVQVLAAQLNSEEDSFGNQYDKGATYAVTNADELEDIISDDEVTNANITLASGDYDSNFKVPGGKNITIAGNGKDTVLSGQIATTSSTAGTITLKNMTIKVDDSIADSTNISQTGKSAIAIWGNQTVICENVTFDMSLADSTAITSWWDTGVGTTIIVRNCTFNCNGQRPIRATGNVTVENCTFNDPYRYAVQLTAKTSTATEMDKAIINFKNNTIVNGANGKSFVYGIQLEGADYGCHDCVINGTGNSIVDGGNDSAMYYCECGKVDHNTITFNTEVDLVHEI